jgi:hypothetical protein
MMTQPHHLPSLITSANHEVEQWHFEIHFKEMMVRRASLRITTFMTGNDMEIVVLKMQ